MKTVTVQLAESYDIHIGSGILNEAARYISQVKAPCTVAIISNTTVWPLHGEKLQGSLKAAGYQVYTYLMPDGECYKTESTYLDILHFLADNHVTRSDLIIALGGGVVGDVTGFAAATYLRGVDYIQVPTTLLAMVDSSVGGKTAIDLPQGKNLVGAFNQPKLVLCDLALLETLPEDVFIDGCAEVIKYGVLYDPELFAHLHTNGLDFQREYVVSRCVELKRDVVCIDEFDTGLRQMLNLGHTIGHAIEKNSNFSISHGRAVAMGMAIISKAGVAMNICDAPAMKDILTVLEKFTLPVLAPKDDRYSSHKLYESALSDKKRTGGTVNLIIPESIGRCIIHKLPVNQLEAVIESGL